MASEHAGCLGAEPLDEAHVELRAFFGLPLPDANRASLDRYLAACAAAAPEFRWPPADNLHLTVRFLGHVEQSIAEGIADRLEAARLQGFDLRLGELGSFGRGRLARVVWLGLSEGSAALAALAAQAEAASAAGGLEADDRPYHAHLTLARARMHQGAPMPALPPPPDLAPWRAAELILYRSRLGRGGAVYEPVRRLILG